MANKLKLLIDFIAYRSKSPTNSPSDDSTQVKLLTQEADFSELCRKQIDIADATVDQSVTLADADSDYILIFTDQEVTIKLNGSSDSITLKPKAAGSKTMCFMNRGSITSLSVSNASGNTASLDIISVNL